MLRKLLYWFRRRYALAVAPWCGMCGHPCVDDDRVSVPYAVAVPYAGEIHMVYRCSRCVQEDEELRRRLAGIPKREG